MKHTALSQFSLPNANATATLAKNKLQWLAIALLSCVILSGCGIFGGNKAKPGAALKGTPEAIYAEAKEELDSSNWTKAIELMDGVQAADALGVFGQQALLDGAYAQWRNGDAVAGLVNIERYLRQFPKSAGVPYALYLKGLIKFNERSGLMTSISKADLSERDPKLLRESYDAFTQLIKEYPESKYSREAAERLTYLVNALAQHEVIIARYYLQQGAPLAAVNRAQGMLKQYSETPAQEEALGISVEAYRQLGLSDLQATSERVLRQNYPSSAFLKQGAFIAKRKSFFSLW